MVLNKYNETNHNMVTFPPNICLYIMLMLIWVLRPRPTSFFTEERSCFRVRVVKYIFVSKWDIRHDVIRIEAKLEGESFSH